ncbi:HTH domain-containing protein [Vibrio sp. DW001]|uniref:helix-turn-helix transcriptional regulator n=1 Tax=Vibrio sp. DW001 TaxID=2912315 RepID=UPI0023AE7FFC|nr:HTH domain-containing protein [Vibrio sp. DW001]WED27232.1 HTH domain-containing protein [Vibrio sp. DW001]
MGRIEKQFQMVEIIRSRRVTTASYLAERMNVSIRTIYRYINDLCLSGIPIVSETRVGYRLDKSFDMPRLMFTEEELLALSLGAKLVQKCSDEYLSDAEETQTQRAIRPLGLAFWGNGWTLASWCEIREDFRVFRLDRIHNACLTTRAFSINNEISLDAFILCQME